MNVKNCNVSHVGAVCKLYIWICLQVNSATARVMTKKSTGLPVIPNGKLMASSEWLLQPRASCSH